MSLNGKGSCPLAAVGKPDARPKGKKMKDKEKAQKKKEFVHVNRKKKKGDFAFRKKKEKYHGRYPGEKGERRGVGTPRAMEAPARGGRLGRRGKRGTMRRRAKRPTGKGITRKKKKETSSN